MFVKNICIVSGETEVSDTGETLPVLPEPYLLYGRPYDLCEDTDRIGTTP